MPRAAWVAVGAICAALTAATVDSSAVLVGGALAAVAVLIAALAVARGRHLKAVAIGVSFGAAALFLRAAVGPAAPSLTTAPPAEAGPWSVLVESVAAPRDGSQSAIGLIEPNGPRLALTMPRYPAVQPGHRIIVDGSPRPPPEGGYGEYLARIGVTATLRSRDLEIVGEAEGPVRAIESLRRATGSALAAALPEPEAGLAAGILIGLRDRVDREVAADFTTAGVSHVVAISGWNIAIVAASIGALAGGLARRRRTALILLAIACYVAFAGASPSVVRAGAMATVVLLARESGRQGRAASALCWAVVLLLAVDPALLRDAGFQLSAVATGGLIAWASPLDARLRRIGGDRLPGWLVECLAVSLAAQAATLPIVLASFGRLSLVAPIVNLGVVPLVVPAMAGGAIALLAGLAGAVGLPGIVVAFLALPGWLALTAMIRVVDAGAAVPFASLEIAPEAAPLLGGAVALVLLAVATRRPPGAASPELIAPLMADVVPSTGTRPAKPSPKGQRAAARVGLALLAVAVAVPVVALTRGPSGVARVTILDVGQGDAVLVEGAHGGRLLVDGGPDPDRLIRALDDRLPPWDRRIDVVIASHPHEDHVAGLPLLLERYTVGRVLHPGMRGPGPGWAAFAAVLGEPGMPALERIAAGDRLRVDDVDLSVLWPDAEGVPDEPADTGTGINNVSVVLLGEVSGRRFLLTGDVEEEIDPHLLDRGVPPVDLLKVAHHGSATASTRAFLDATRPMVAIASAGARNPYGHPAASTLDRLAASGALVFRTDADGSVEVTLGDALRVRTSGARSALETAADERRRASIGSAEGATSATAFRCAIPPPAVLPGDAGAGRVARENVRPSPASQRTPAEAGPRGLVRYDDQDDGPRTDERHGPPAVPRSTAPARAPLARRGGRRGVARGAKSRARRRPRLRPRSPPGRACRPSGG